MKVEGVGGRMEEEEAVDGAEGGLTGVLLLGWRERERW